MQPARFSVFQDTDLLVPAVTATEGIAGKTGSCHSAKVVSFTNELFLIASGDTAESAVGWSSLDSTGAAIVVFHNCDLFIMSLECLKQVSASVRFVNTLSIYLSGRTSVSVD